MKRAYQLVVPVTPVRVVRQAAGFTLIELLITVAIAAVLLGIGAPSFADFIRSQKVKTVSMELSSSLLFARSEAIKRNANVVVTKAASNWSDGWNVTVTINGTSTVLDSKSAFAGVTITGSVTGVTYGGDGRVQGTAVPSFSIDGTSQTRCVTVSLSGLPNSKKGSCS